MIVAEDFHRAPFAGQDQVWETVSIKIAEHRRAHQARQAESSAVVGVQNPAGARAAEQYVESKARPRHQAA